MHMLITPVFGVPMQSAYLNNGKRKNTENTHTRALTQARGNV